MNPAQGAPTLDASVESTGRASDPCAGHGSPHASRARILVWLAEGSREVTWALCSLPRERWTDAPPSRLSEWPALRHVRHLALREHHLTLPLVRRALGDADSGFQAEPQRSTLEFEQADAAWDPVAAGESVGAIVEGFGETRFELLQRLEAAPDDALQQLEPLLLDARQHELEHLAVVWKIALHWDRAVRASVPSVPLHAADRLEESH